MTVTSVVLVGLIDCGEVSHVIHIPKLSILSDAFQLPISATALSTVAIALPEKVTAGVIPRFIPDTEEIYKSLQVDFVFRDAEGVMVGHITFRAGVRRRQAGWKTLYMPESEACTAFASLESGTKINQGNILDYSSSAFHVLMSLEILVPAWFAD
ncbi:hypothetical protein V1523DRAFT_428894 [Lipomyces doorenjongii]